MTRINMMTNFRCSAQTKESKPYVLNIENLGEQNKVDILAVTPRIPKTKFGIT